MTSLAIRLLELEDDELEQFIEFWAEGLTERGYDTVERIGKANDKGRDVIGFKTTQRHEGAWDLYQCKRKTRGSKLSVAEMLLELGKMFFHHDDGAYRTLPVRYWFVAPRGIVGDAADLINNPSTLKQKLIDEWDNHCAKKITARKTVSLSDQIRSAIDGYDFGRIACLTANVISKAEAFKPAMTRVLGLMPGDAPPGIVPPAVQPDEMEYVDQLRQVYGEARGVPFATADDVLADADHGDHLRDQRVRFCDATAFLRFHRDSVAPEYLTAFKDEVYYGAIDVHRDRHDNMLARVNAVMKHASTMTAALNGKLARVTVRQGMCHHLANEGKMKWAP
ncbi:restriction endonuclease [Methylocystis sp. H4A]|uniref:ABC-three component system protein n=1 Tax=Methylocystis sp. H4A TaxID=2785788 RepID=UPI0018C306A5|nr:ABC-three component system protein [Methylocystis sp. H4A]MBG0802875.1 restriction endonuclease [Methylocystis sp. H4A]